MLTMTADFMETDLLKFQAVPCFMGNYPCANVCQAATGIAAHLQRDPCTADLSRVGMSSALPSLPLQACYKAGQDSTCFGI